MNEAFATKYFPGVNPLGQRFGLENKKADIEIIGVSKSVRHQEVKLEIPPVAYLPYGQDPDGLFGLNFELRAAGEPLALAEAVRKVVREADSRIPVSGIDTQARMIGETMGQERTLAALGGAFAVLAVLIACVGLYGTMAYSIARRTAEIGVRMALGAQRIRVLNMVLREVALVAALGVALGLLGCVVGGADGGEFPVRREGAGSAGDGRGSYTVAGRRARRGICAGAQSVAGGSVEGATRGIGAGSGSVASEGDDCGKQENRQQGQQAAVRFGNSRRQKPVRTGILKAKNVERQAGWRID